MAKKKSVYGPGDKTQAPKAAATNKSFFGNPEYLNEKIREAAGVIAGKLQGTGTGTGKMPMSGAAGKAAALTEAKKKQVAGVPQGMKLKNGGKASKKKTKKPRGVGVAQRGYGKALTGKKK